MKNINIYKKSHVFLIGIGGISMSGIAKILRAKGVAVSGSDMSDSNELRVLESLGVKVYRGHNSQNITSDIDLVVYSGAIHNDNCELIKAKACDIPTIERSQALGMIADHFDHVIAIAGTHGKTTTAAMLADIFVCAGLNPTIHLGGQSVNLQSNTVIGGHEYLIVEACEYRNSFASLHPETAIITNIETDHLDFYKNLDDIRAAFMTFAENAECLITNENIFHDNVYRVSDYSVRNLSRHDHIYEYDVYYLDKFFVHIRLKMLGEHNIHNALFAIATAHHYGIPSDIIRQALDNFKGVERRYEMIGKINNVPVIVDYAHHPSEIARSWQGINEDYYNVLCVFQPHTYSRTKALFDPFRAVLDQIPNIILYPTYAARESPIIGGTAEDLFDALASAMYVSDLDSLLNIFEDNTHIAQYDCILVLGAGDLAEKLKNCKDIFTNANK